MSSVNTVRFLRRLMADGKNTMSPSDAKRVGDILDRLDSFASTASLNEVVNSLSEVDSSINSIAVSVSGINERVDTVEGTMVNWSGAMEGFSRRAKFSALINAPTSGITDAPTNAPVTLSIVLLGLLVTEVGSSNSRYNALAAKFNQLRASHDALVTKVNDLRVAGASNV